MAEAPSHEYPTAPLAVPAAPEKTGGRAIGVLLVHGFTGSPAAMKPWGQALADQGLRNGMITNAAGRSTAISVPVHRLLATRHDCRIARAGEESV